LKPKGGNVFRQGLPEAFDQWYKYIEDWRTEKSYFVVDLPAYKAESSQQIKTVLDD